MADNYLDVRRFQDVCEGSLGSITYSNGRMVRHVGSWIELWGDWMTSVLQFFINVICDMPFGLAREL